MTDCCIIGGGIIGLSIARELAGRGLSVRVLTRDAGRDTASWAAAGIFPPAPDGPDATANERFTAFSDRLHRIWAEELRAETGIDNELEACGGLYVAADPAGLTRLADAAARWAAQGVRFDRLDAPAIASHEPALRPAVDRGGILGGLLLPDELRIRPPRHLAALERSCRRRGVEITPAEVRDIDVRGDRVERLVVGGTAAESVQAGHYCLAAGAWSGRLAAALGLHVETRPIRGQIALVRLSRPVLGRVVNHGFEYLVPRRDGRLLVGSTLEDAGFAPVTTPEVIARLLAFAHGLLGPLPDAVLEQSWAGLRPGSADGLPLIGPAPACRNAWVAAGHFRAGLHQSTGTAVVIADLLTGRTPACDPSPFAPDRPPRPDAVEGLGAFLARAASPT